MPDSDEHLLFLADKGMLKQDFFVLGGGSNILFLDNYEGIIVHPMINFIKKIDEFNGIIFIETGAGTAWDDFVKYCVENNYYGVENLSYIPGTVGAAPVQNVGAYGMEASHSVYSVRYFDAIENSFNYISGSQCNFGYRSSIFKESLKNRAIITSVVFALHKEAPLQLHYGALNTEIERIGYGATLHGVRHAVFNIRKNKLPDPAILGNAGSFFKNPIVSKEKSDYLLKLYPTIPTYDDGNDRTKISAAWLIEQCGWRGKRIGNVGVHLQQSLVLVNYGYATGKEILTLAQNINNDVQQRFGIALESEVTIVGS
jgi:UDP-N-acetylmuramate dehydrogenase